MVEFYSGHIGQAHASNFEKGAAVWRDRRSAKHSPTTSRPPIETSGCSCRSKWLLGHAATSKINAGKNGPSWLEPHKWQKRVDVHRNSFGSMINHPPKAVQVPSHVETQVLTLYDNQQGSEEVP